MYKRLIGLFLILFLYIPLYANVAVIPYRVNNTSIYFPPEKGLEYAKLIAVAALSKKNIEIFSPTDIDIDLKRFGVNPQNMVTEDDLYLLGKARYLDYILTGSITKVKNKYISKSILYSVKDRKTIEKIKVSANSIFKLAEKEIKEAFVNFSNKTTGKDKTSIDVTFIIDMSYKINRDWGKIKSAILFFSSKAIDNLGIDTKICIIPFSESGSVQKVSVSINSIQSIRKNLNFLKPAGETSSENLFKALKFSVKNIRWRRASEKKIIIISNSRIGKTNFVERFAIIARKKGIKINSISFGGLKSGDDHIIKRLSEITEGSHKNVSYHQRLFGSSGNKIELYMENGRLFQSSVYNKLWKEGLLKYNRYQANYGKPGVFLDEIFFDEKKYNPGPYTMSTLYPSITENVIINQEKIESNINEILLMSTDSLLRKHNAVKKPYGKALLSDGKISFWIDIYDKKAMNFFSQKNSLKYFFPIGIIIRKNTDKIYGLSFEPVVYDITKDYIPDMIMANLNDIIKKRKYYMLNGIFYPPLWFINVKVEKVKKFKKEIDIRDR